MELVDVVMKDMEGDLDSTASLLLALVIFLNL